MSTPALHKEVVFLRTTPGWRSVVEAWRREQHPIPSEAEAIRRLVEIALAGQGLSVPSREMGRPGRPGRSEAA